MSIFLASSGNSLPSMSFIPNQGATFDTALPFQAVPFPEPVPTVTPSIGDFLNVGATTLGVGAGLGSAFSTEIPTALIGYASAGSSLLSATSSSFYNVLSNPYPFTGIAGLQ